MMNLRRHESSSGRASRNGPPSAAERGFSYLEMIVAMGIVLVAAAIAFNFVVKFGSVMNTETTTLAMQQSGRVVLDEMTRHIQQIGYNIRRPEAFNPAVWQHAIVYAAAHELIFNSDIDSRIGWLPPGESITLPDGSTYTGEGLGATTAGAETYVYTLDGDGDGDIDGDDRADAVTGSYNPASLTDNPLDFALFRRVYGFNGTDYGGALQPVGPYLLSSAAGDFSYPDGTTPDPLFVYWLTEDLNGDGRLQDHECVNDVVQACPPSTERDPQLYLWGDTDFDGTLSEAEKSALLSMEVSSTGWSKNRLVSGGSYKSTTLAAQTDPSAANAYEIEVADATKLGEGYLIEIGSGNSAERFYVEQTSTSVTPNRVLLTSDVMNVHPIGTTVRVLPETLLRAVRTVGVTYTAIADRRDIAGKEMTAGRSGRMGAHGLDFRITPYHRKIEVINAPTSATSPDTAPTGADVCPLVVLNRCTHDATESTIRYTSVTGAQPLNYLVTDTMGNPMSEVGVTFTNSDLSIGTIGDLDVISDAQGIATALYTPTGALGVDTVTATVECETGGTTYTAEADLEITFYEVTTTIAEDCLTTVSPRVGTPTTTFELEVVSPDGPVSDHELELALGFDPLYLPDSPDFNSLVGELFVEGSSVGTTNSSGEMDPQTFTTDGDGKIAGSIELSSAQGVSSRLNLYTKFTQPGCSGGAGQLTSKIDYFLLTHDSTLPQPGCTDLLPCQITATTPAPRVEAQLTFNGAPIPNADLSFTTFDVEVPTGAGDPGASELIPESGITTDSSGAGEVIVSNNGSPVITPLNQLKTQVEVSSGGDPLMCRSGDIVTSSQTTQFNFEAPANVCIADVNQFLISRRDDTKLCMHFKNNNKIDTGCPMRIVGMQVAIYDALGLNLDSTENARVKKIEGGGVSAIPDCDDADKVRIFEDKCHSPQAILNNNEVWMFQEISTCHEPYLDVGPQEYFHLPLVEFGNKWPKDRPMDITIYFECNGDCNTGMVDHATFRVRTPS